MVDIRTKTEARPGQMTGPQTIPVMVHDRESWTGRGMYYDVLALTLLLLTALALGLDIYTAGFLRAHGAPSITAVNFKPLAKLGAELMIFIGSFAWVAARLIRASYRELPGSG